MPNTRFIASLDVGTTTVRCIILNSNVDIVGSASEQVELLYPEPGLFEIDPSTLWQSIVKTIQDSIRVANLTPKDIDCLAICTQRCSFITWDSETNEYFHNFITWKDLRADELVKKWNSSLLMKTINKVSYCLYILSRSKRFLAGSVMKHMNSQVTLRLLWQMQNNQRLKDAIANKRALFGTLDSWLLHKLRKGSNTSKSIEHISDVTSSTATGFFDPFTVSWATWAFSLFSIKAEMLPKVVENSYDFGSTDESIFGWPIKIASSMGDQSAAMWGSCCFKEGDVKVTLGTGSFLNLNTNGSCQASVHGLYPLVAWRFKSRESDKKDDIVYCMEGASNDTGTIIKWAINFGLFDDPSKSSDIAESVNDTDGVCFVPAFSGLGPPVNDHQAASGFLGVRPSTRKAHLVRALLESIVFRVAQIYKCTIEETHYTISEIRVDGGVSKNNFICQMLADVTGLKVERATNSESSVLGTAFVAGLNRGVWKSKEELIQLRKLDRIFLPRPEMKNKYTLKMKLWENALERFKGWYSQTEAI